ncbi:MAG: RNA polymerase sigma factor [Patescibacteria group bacterium]|nr:RNA polymerase sigma factor [Patescibacteria group bacterium]
MNEAVLKKALSGDKKAFSQVYSYYFDDLWRWVYSRIKNKDITSDIISDSFIALYENIRNIKHPKALKSYLYKITKNRMIKFYAEEKPVNLSALDLDRIQIGNQLANNQEIEDEKTDDNRRLEVKLEEVLSKLPKMYEEVLRLRFIAGMKIREVAEVLDKTEGNVSKLFKIERFRNRKH